MIDKEKQTFVLAMRKSIEALISTTSFKFDDNLHEAFIRKELLNLDIDENYSRVTDDFISKNYTPKNLCDISHMLVSLTPHISSVKIENDDDIKPFFEWKEQYVEFAREHNQWGNDANGNKKENINSCVPKKIMLYGKEIEIDDHFVKTITDHHFDVLELCEKNDSEENNAFWRCAILDIGVFCEDSFVLNTQYGGDADMDDFLEHISEIHFLTKKNEKNVLVLNWYGLWSRLAKK